MTATPAAVLTTPAATPPTRPEPSTRTVPVSRTAPSTRTAPPTRGPSGPAARRTGAERTATRPRLLLPPVAEPPRALAAALDALVPTRSVLSPLTTGAWPVPARTEPPTAEHLPDPTRLCGAVVVAAVEVLHRSRPVAQLARWVSPDVYDALAAAAAATPTGPRARAVIRSTHLSRVGPTVAEGTVVVHDGSRFRAAAVRLEVHRGSWRATVLQIG